MAHPYVGSMHLAVLMLYRYRFIKNMLAPPKFHPPPPRLNYIVWHEAVEHS